MNTPAPSFTNATVPPMVMSVFSKVAFSGTQATNEPPFTSASVTVNVCCDVPSGHVRRSVCPARLIVFPANRLSFALIPLQSQSVASVIGGSSATLWYVESFATVAAFVKSKLNTPKKTPLRSPGTAPTASAPTMFVHTQFAGSSKLLRTPAPTQCAVATTSASGTS